MKIVYSRDFNRKRWNSIQMMHIAHIGNITTTILDRTGNMNTHNYIYDPIPEDYHTDMSFEECCYESANSLWSLKKPIHVSWSGGIDSTTVLLSMLETKPKDGELFVRYTNESAREFPSLYEKLIRGKFIPTNSVFDKDYYDLPDIIRVSGDCGDGVYGTDHGLLLSKHHLLDMSINNIYHWTTKDLYSKASAKYVRDENKNEILDAVLEYISYSPIQIKTLFDMYWWIYFNTKWMDIQLKKTVKWSQSLNWKNHISFYNTPNFQRWSITNHEIKFQNQLKDFKKPSKEFIHKHFKDEDYRVNKTIRPSGLEVVAVDDMSSNMVKLLLDNGKFWLKNDKIEKHIDEKLEIITH